MSRACPYCSHHETRSSEDRSIVRAGWFRRKSDGQRVQRYHCTSCGRGFSSATFNDCFRQNKRHFNHRVKMDFVEGVSMRAIARKHNLHRTTVKRKLIYLGAKALRNLKRTNARLPKVSRVQFDDQETCEQSKCKPLSITLAVEHKTRRILDFEISQSPPKSCLAKKAFKLYGPRKDERKKGRQNLFRRLQNVIQPNAIIESDQHPHYPPDVKRFFPQATHVTFKGRSPKDHGMGELKKGFDPLFSLNHTCAMNRDRIKRLARKTWAISKKRYYLELHLAIYADHHNQKLEALKPYF